MNSFVPPTPVTAWRDLEDGTTLWRILGTLHSSWEKLAWRPNYGIGDIDAEYFHGELPEVDKNSKENWIPRWQNREPGPVAPNHGSMLMTRQVKYIDKMVTTYIRDECDQLHFLSKNLNPDLKAIAIDGSSPQIIKVCSGGLTAVA